MTRSRIIATLFGATIALGACADSRPTAPADDIALKRDKAEKIAERRALLTDVPVTGALLDDGVAAGSFAGTFSATRFDIDPETRLLSLTGVLNGTATLLDGTAVPVVNQQFTTPVILSGASASSASAVMHPVSSVACASAAPQPATTELVTFRRVQLAGCNVLFLDLGPLHLDLLGLTVDLSQVVLDVNAVPGPGNLLGNLLCALLGLLDVTALLTAITQLLTVINDVLAGLNPGGVTGASFGSPTTTISAAISLSA
jgi:hypothetical protein